MEEIAAGPELEVAIVEGVKALMAILEMKEIVKEELDKQLAALESDVKRVRKELR